MVGRMILRKKLQYSRETFPINDSAEKYRRRCPIPGTQEGDQHKRQRHHDFCQRVEPVNGTITLYKKG